MENFRTKTKISWADREALIHSAIPKDIVLDLSDVKGEGDDCETIRLKGLKQVTFRKEWEKEFGHLYEITYD